MYIATPHSIPALRRALLALVAAAVLCAQWLGVQHRVEHGHGLAANAAVSGVPADAHHAHHHDADSPEPATWHDCAAFDHAALGDGPPAATPSCVPPPSTATRVAGHASTPGAAPQALGYLSRAPPRA